MNQQTMYKSHSKNILPFPKLIFILSLSLLSTRAPPHPSIIIGHIQCKLVVKQCFIILFSVYLIILGHSCNGFHLSLSLSPIIHFIPLDHFTPTVRSLSTTILLSALGSRSPSEFAFLCSSPPKQQSALHSVHYNRPRADQLNCLL